MNYVTSSMVDGSAVVAMQPLLVGFRYPVWLSLCHIPSRKIFVASVSCRTAVLAIHTVHTIPSGTTGANQVRHVKTDVAFVSGTASTLTELGNTYFWHPYGLMIFLRNLFNLSLSIVCDRSAYFMLFLGAPFRSFPPMLIYGCKEYLD